MIRKDDVCSSSYQPTRRVWVTGLAALGFGSVFGRSAVAEPIAIQNDSAQRFMKKAFEMKHRAAAVGDQAYGAVIAKGNLIVSAAPSRVITKADPTAHAEMEALRDAAAQLVSRDLSGCVLYSSSPPCPMCEAAAFWANIERLYHGDPIMNIGAPSLRRC
jgi:tRNA(Arg) A34 adenosine deaminase TadA